jgi:hypothetical protein
VQFQPVAKLGLEKTLNGSPTRGGTVVRNAQSLVTAISLRGTWVTDTDLRRLACPIRTGIGLRDLYFER